MWVQSISACKNTVIKIELLGGGGQDCVVSIVTHYWLNSMEFKPWKRQNCLDPLRLAPRPTQPSVKRVMDFPPGVKVARVWC